MPHPVMILNHLYHHDKQCHAYSVVHHLTAALKSGLSSKRFPPASLSAGALAP